MGRPKNLVGKLDHHNALTGDDLRDFVNLKLFPYLHGFKAKATGPNTIARSYAPWGRVLCWMKSVTTASAR